MGDALNDRNASAIKAFVVFNGLLFFAAVHVAPLDLDFVHLAARCGVAGVALLVATVLNHSLTPATKAKLVYLRRVDVLPGHRAFTVHAHQDPRVDVAALEAFHGDALPTLPPAQNQLWFRWFKRVEDRASVAHKHRMSLLFRDLAALAALLALVFGPVGVYYAAAFDVWIYVGFLLAQYALLRLAAVNSGNRFVTTVLAEVSARPPGP